MALWTMILLVVFGLSATVLGVMLRWGNRWVRFLAYGLLVPWLYYAQWYGRMMWDIRLVDDAYSRVMQDRLLTLTAAQNGQERIPLADVTPFVWHAMCEVWATEDYTDNAELKRVFGAQHPVSLDAADAWSDTPYPLFATASGPYLLQPFFGRFTQAFQSRWMGRHYASALKGKGYVIELELVRKPDHSAPQLCFTPDEAWVRVYPEPVWMHELNHKLNKF